MIKLKWSLFLPTAAGASILFGVAIDYLFPIHDPTGAGAMTKWFWLALLFLTRAVEVGLFVVIGLLVVPRRDRQMASGLVILGILVAMFSLPVCRAYSYSDTDSFFTAAGFGAIVGGFISTSAFVRLFPSRSAELFS